MANLTIPRHDVPLVDASTGAMNPDWYRVFKALEMFQAPSFTVAGLPESSGSARIAFASDGRKNGEAADAGTGVLVFRDASGVWCAVDTGAAVAA